MLPNLNDGGNMVHMNNLRVQLAQRKIDVALSTKALAIRPEGVLCAGPEGEVLCPADTVIYAVGQKPLSDEAMALGPCAPEFYPVGDCVASRSILAATTEAYNAARDIGRI